jgi:formamidopyrimidine-DNA glycosylase
MSLNKNEIKNGFTISNVISVNDGFAIISKLKNAGSNLGKSGNFQQFFHVYGRKNKICSRISCKGKIEKIVISDRSSFYCNKCQI